MRHRRRREYPNPIPTRRSMIRTSTTILSITRRGSKTTAPWVKKKNTKKKTGPGVELLHKPNLTKNGQKDNSREYTTSFFPNELVITTTTTAVAAAAAATTTWTNLNIRIHHGVSLNLTRASEIELACDARHCWHYSTDEANRMIHNPFHCN